MSQGLTGRAFQFFPDGSTLFAAIEVKVAIGEMTSIWKIDLLRFEAPARTGSLLTKVTK
jgi:hypothetical protein